MTTPVRFGQDFVGRVANPRDILQYYRKKKTAERSKPYFPHKLGADMSKRPKTFPTRRKAKKTRNGMIQQQSRLMTVWPSFGWQI